MSDSYTLELPAYVTRHYRSTVLQFGDYAGIPNHKLDAEARSGDYFVTVATELESLAEQLPEMSVVATSMALSKLADELLYMQRHYRIAPKIRPDKLTELG